MKKQLGIIGLMAAAAILTFTGCTKDSPSSPLVESVATEDAAESIASAVGQNDGGALDQMADVSDIATVAGITDGTSDQKASASLSSAGTVDTTYDANTGTWTMTLSRERGSASDAYYASYTRVYHFQFLNASGQPQKYYRVPNGSGGIDTAASLTFTIVSGSGEHHTPHLSQKLTNIGGSWTVTGLNTSTVTINGTYTRSAVDTVTTRNAVRTLDHTLSLTFTNIQAPRGNRAQMAQNATGTITGTYNASITFQRGALYSDKTVSRDFTITLGSGKGNIAIDGKAYVALLDTGMLQ